MKKYLVSFIFLLISLSLHAASLTTTFASNNGQDGNMFDVVTLQNVTITGFDININSNSTIEIYGKNGTHVGSETTPGNWNLITTIPNVVSAGEFNATSIQNSISVAIPAASIYSFYITSNNNTSFRYTDGSGLGNVYVQDTHIQILEGAGKEYPFSSTFTPRIWNGTVYYDNGIPTNYAPVITSDGGTDNATLSVKENNFFVTKIEASDADTGDTLIYSISGGVDASKFQIDQNNGNLLFFPNKPDYENPQDIGDTIGNNTYVVEVTVTDDGTPVMKDTQTLTIRVTNNDEIDGDSTQRTIREVTSADMIAGLYIAFFNRAADYDGMSYWKNQIESSNGDASEMLNQIASGFATHPKFNLLYSGMDNKEFVETIYRNILGYDGDEEGINFWTDLLLKGKSRSDMVAEFVELTLTIDLNETNFPNLSKEELTLAKKRQDLLLNRTEIATLFTDTYMELTNIVNTDELEKDPAYLASIEILMGVSDKTWSIEYIKTFIQNNNYEDFAELLEKLQSESELDIWQNTIVKYEKVESPTTGVLWLDRNIGAEKVCDQMRDDYPSDYKYGISQNECFGDYLAINNVQDWGFRDPCPAGSRLPTIYELKAEKLTANNSINEILNIPIAGQSNLYGTKDNLGEYGYLLSRTVNDGYVMILKVYEVLSGSIILNNDMAVSARCLIDDN